MIPQPTVRERVARARPVRFQREQQAAQSLAAWCSENLQPSQLAMLQACQTARVGASQHYARYGRRCSQESTAAEYKLCLTIATEAQVDFSAAADFVCMRG